MVAGPRNQRYLQPVTTRRDGLLAAVRQRQDTGKIAGELDLQAAVLGDEADLLDEGAQGVGGFGTQRGAIELGLQVGDLLPARRGRRRGAGAGA